MRIEQLTSDALAEGHLVREPERGEPGYWAGAPGAFYDNVDGRFYLCYRIRRPRGVEPDRGAELRIAHSDDSLEFHDIATITKDQFGSPSIERCALRRSADNRWHLFVSSVDPGDGRWCISRIEADRPDGFDPTRAQRVFSATDVKLEGVKDPWLFVYGREYFMLASVALPTGTTGPTSHETGDIYNTGQCLSATGLAASDDLETWAWRGVVLQSGDGGWDKYCRRLNSAVPVDDKWLGFYDGSAGHDENYEERTGLAVGTAPGQWRAVSPERPELVSPHAGGSLRYVDALPVGPDVHLYYELARPDGAHELRTVMIPRNRIDDVLARAAERD